MFRERQPQLHTLEAQLAKAIVQARQSVHDKLFDHDTTDPSSLRILYANRDLLDVLCLYDPHCLFITHYIRDNPTSMLAIHGITDPIAYSNFAEYTRTVRLKIFGQDHTEHKARFLPKVGFAAALGLATIGSWAIGKYDRDVVFRISFPQESAKTSLVPARADAPVPKVKPPQAGLSQEDIGAYWERYRESYLPTKLTMETGGKKLVMDITEGFGWLYEEVPPNKIIVRRGSLLPATTESEKALKSQLGDTHPLLLALHSSAYARHSVQHAIRDGKEVMLHIPDATSFLDFTAAGNFFLSEKSRRNPREPIEINPALIGRYLTLTDRQGRDHVFRLEQARTADSASIFRIIEEPEYDVQIVFCRPIAQDRAGRFINDPLGPGGLYVLLGRRV